ncbi:MAG: clostripain-related cysteine peptidase [Oscillospiraceae bacterium]|nr:clostripain-related cysteine peptidase [Oscillospiraceae bacterium]
MIKRKFLSLLFCVAIALGACTAQQPEVELPGPRLGAHNPNRPSFTREISKIDFSGTPFTPWDIEAASASLKVQPRRPYTVMIYMIGSDLESDEGAATTDIAEMLEAGILPEGVNVLLLTGGANHWQNSVVPENECVVWQIEGENLTEIAGLGLLNMGNAGTLASFINFGMRNFPAERYGLILWDHAGGSIAGYGHDEKFDSSLSLLELNYAFERSDAKHTRFEFLGFDACLMASVEMAVVAAPYAKYMVASQDLEPGDGWDYAFLGALSQNPQFDGAAAGKLIVDSFIEFYGRKSKDALTLSVIDLAKAGEVMAAMDGLMTAAGYDLLREREPAFNAIAHRRSATKTFGTGSPRDNDCDMVDLADVAHRLSDLYPGEAEQLLQAIESAVVYNRHNSRDPLCGLTAYYIYAGRETSELTMGIYASLGMGRGYTKFLRSFAGALTGSPDAEEFPTKGRKTRSATQKRAHQSAHLTLWRPLDEEGDYYAQVGIRTLGTQNSMPENLWPSIGGELVCLYEVERSPGRALYAVPVLHNDRQANLMVLTSEAYPAGKILGTRQREGFVMQRGYDEIEPGDKIAFYYRIESFDPRQDVPAREWLLSTPKTLEESPRISWLALRENAGLHQRLMLTDLRGEEIVGDNTSFGPF